MRAWRTAPNFAMLLEAIPIFKENPKTQELAQFHNKPLTPASLGLLKELPSVFNFIKGSSGAIHLIILGIPILIVLVGQAK